MGAQAGPSPLLDPRPGLPSQSPCNAELGLLAAWFGCGNEINYRLFFFFKAKMVIYSICSGKIQEGWSRGAGLKGSRK